MPTRRKINVTLNWSNPQPLDKENIPENISKNKGIYIIILGRSDIVGLRNNLEIIYIGESENIYERIKTHNKWDCWRKNKSTKKLFISFAEYNGDNSKRRKIECCLINKIISEENDKACNEECVGDYSQKDYTVNIINTGYRKLLEREYNC